MKLTIVRLVTFSDQDHIDLARSGRNIPLRRCALMRPTAFMPRVLTSACWLRFA